MVNSGYIVMCRTVLVAMFMNMHGNNTRELQYITVTSETCVD